MTRRQIKWLPSAVRMLARLPRTVQDEALSVAESLLDDPRPPESLAMTGPAHGYHRIHVGPGHRMVYKLTHQFIIIVRVDHRGSVYEGLRPIDQ